MSRSVEKMYVRIRFFMEHTFQRTNGFSIKLESCSGLNKGEEPGTPPKMVDIVYS